MFIAVAPEPVSPARFRVYVPEEAASCFGLGLAHLFGRRYGRGTDKTHHRRAQPEAVLKGRDGIVVLPLFPIENAQVVDRTRMVALQGDRFLVQGRLTEIQIGSVPAPSAVPFAGGWVSPPTRNLVKLGGAFYVEKMPDSALVYLTDALALAPNADAANGLGLMFARQSRFKEAREWFLRRRRRCRREWIP